MVAGQTAKFPSLSRSAPVSRRQAPASSAGSQRTNSAAPASRAAQDAAIKAAGRTQQAVPKVQPLPGQPTDPYATGAPYRSPKPVYSDADYQRALETDFQFARRAADIATQNAIARDTAGVNVRATAQQRLAAQQNAAAASLQRSQLSAAAAAQQRQIAAGERSQSRQSQLARDLQGNQVAAAERSQGRQLSAAAASQASAQGFASTQGDKAYNNQVGLNQQTAGLQSRLMAQAAQQRLNEIAATSGSRRTTVSGTSGVGGSPLRSQIEAVIGIKESELRLKAIQGDRGALARLQQLSGSGLTAGGGPVAPAAPAEDPRLALARENNAAAAARQAAQLSAADRDRADRLASSERMQAANLQYQRDAPGIAANAEEDLRKAARRAALAVYNSAGRGRQLATA